jgi:GT2 family glycosyltransferase
MRMNASGAPAVSVVIGSYNRFRYLKATLGTVRRELADLPHEIIVVDGGSADGSLRWLLRQKDVITIVQHNRGDWNGEPIERKSWGYFMNLAFRAASGKYVCMLSDDCLVIPGAIVNGLGVFEHALELREPRVGAVAFYWRNWPEQDSYWIGFTFGNRMFVNHGLYLREALEKVGFIDAQSYFFYHADGDLCLRLDEAGFRCIDSPNSFIEHASHANLPLKKTNYERQKHDWDAYSARWRHLGEPKQGWKSTAYTDAEQTADKYWNRRMEGLRPLLRKRAGAVARALRHPLTGVRRLSDRG